MAPCGEHVAPRVPRLGFWRTGIPGSVGAPLPLNDFLSFLRGRVPRTIRVGYMCRNPPASQAFNFPGGGARRSPWCKYPWTLALDGNTLDDCSLTFSWSSARPWASRVWPGPLPGPLWIRPAGGEDEVEGWVWAWCRPFRCCRRVAGVQEAQPLSGGCRRKSLGFRSRSTPRAARASPGSSGICCTCWAR